MSSNRPYRNFLPFFLLVISIVLTLPNVQAHGAANDDINNCNSDTFTEIILRESDDVKLKYKSDNTTLTIQMSSPFIAWHSVGFNDMGRMFLSDCIIGTTPDDVKKFRIGVGYTAQAVVEMDESQQSLTSTSFTQENGETVLTFTKLLQEGNEGEVSIEEGDSVTLIWAVGYDNKLEFGHDRSRSGSVKIPLCASDGLSFTSLDEQYKNFFKIHGILAVVIFGAMMPLAILASALRKYLNQKIMNKELWYIIHSGFNYTSAVLVVVLFIYIVMGKNGVNASHFTNAHEIIGLIVIILVPMQVLLGTFRTTPAVHAPSSKNDEEDDDDENADKFTEDDSKKNCLSRAQWYILHALLGTSIVAISMYQLQSGIYHYDQIYDSGTFTALFWTWFVVVILILLLTSISARAR